MVGKQNRSIELSIGFELGSQIDMISYDTWDKSVVLLMSYDHVHRRGNACPKSLAHMQMGAERVVKAFRIPSAETVS